MTNEDSITINLNTILIPIGLMVVLFLMSFALTEVMGMGCSEDEEVMTPGGLPQCVDVNATEATILETIDDMEEPVNAERITAHTGINPRTIAAVAQKRESFVCWEEGDTGYCERTEQGGQDE